MSTYLAAEEYHGLQINTIRIFDNEKDAMKYAKKVGRRNWGNVTGRKLKSWYGCRVYEVYSDKKPRLIKVEEPV